MGCSLGAPLIALTESGERAYNHGSATAGRGLERLLSRKLSAARAADLADTFAALRTQLSDSRHHHEGNHS